MPNDTTKRTYFVLFLLVFMFVLIVAKGLTVVQPGDENVYYYMGKLITEGKVPYRDFFYAHPPLHLYLIALVYSIFGFNIVALKLMPLISTLVSAFFIFKISREKFDSNVALLSSLLFLFAYGTMFNSVFSFGIDIATMFLVIGVYFLIKEKPFLSGISLGLASITRLLSLIPIIAILVILFFSNRKKFLKLSSAFLAVFIFVNGVFALSYFGKYLTPVYKYHTLKSLSERENFREYADIIKLNWMLFSSALLFIFAKEKKKVSFFAIASIAYLAFLLLLKKIFGFYFIIVFPFLAILGGYSAINVYNNLGLKKWLKILASAILLLVFLWNLSSDTIFLQKIGFKGFERGQDIAEFVKSNSNNKTMLFGDDSVTPLLALLTGKKIAFDFVDTNPQVFASGIKNLSAVLEELKGRDVLFVMRSTQGISSFSELREFLNRDCSLLSQFHDKIEGDYLIYNCI